MNRRAFLRLSTGAIVVTKGLIGCGEKTPAGGLDTAESEPLPDLVDATVTKGPWLTILASGTARLRFETLEDVPVPVVVHVDAPYRTVKDLRDARPGWVDPLSLGGCLLAIDHLRQRGLLPSELGKPRYFGTHPAALAALAARETDVGAVSVISPFDEDVRAALELHAGPAARHLRSLAVTAAAPTDGVVITDVLPLARVEQVERALFLPADSALCVAMEIDGFERAAPGEYAELTRLFPDR